VNAFQLTVAEIRVSDGVILRTFQIPLSTGSWDGPFMVLRTALPGSAALFDSAQWDKAAFLP